MQKIDDYMKIKDAVTLIGVSKNTLRNWERQGKIKVHRNPYNGYRLYHRNELEALLLEISNSIAKDSIKGRS